MKVLTGICAAMACIAPMADAAGGDWGVLDLGSSRAEEVCVAAAQQAFTDYGRVFGIEETARGTWTVYGYGLEHGATDGIVTCTFATGSTSRATLVLYSADQVRAGLIAQRFESYFADHNARIGREWLNRALKRNNM